MKRFPIIPLLAIVFTPAIAKTITSPICEYTPINYIVESLETNDSTTRLNLTFVNLPNHWCSIDSTEIDGDVSGKKYRLLRTENYTLGTRQNMPESGMQRFSLVYEALSPADSVIDVMLDKDFIYGLNTTGCQPATKYHTHITGTYPKKETALMIAPAKAKPYSQGVIWAPVHDGQFSADIFSDELQAYEINDEFGFLKGFMTYGHLFSENTDVNVKFLEKDGELQSLSISAPDGTLTADYNKIYDKEGLAFYNSPFYIKQDSLINAKAFYIPEYYALTERVATHPEEMDSIRNELSKLDSNGGLLTEEARIVKEELNRWLDNDRLNMIIEDAVALDNLAGLFMLQKEIWHSKAGSNIHKAYQEHYAGKFPDGQYSRYFENLDQSEDPIPGNKYLDFTAPDLYGKLHKLSDEIDGHVALIDLWASWCGGCRKTSKSMIPVYEEFAPKGFKIVGVARESGNTDAMVKAIEKDGYPWLNLVELNDATSLWAKYRIPGGGGSTFLVDPQGKILMVNPSASDVRQILQFYYPSK